MNYSSKGIVVLLIEDKGREPEMILQILKSIPLKGCTLFIRFPLNLLKGDPDENITSQQ